MLKFNFLRREGGANSEGDAYLKGGAYFVYQFLASKSRRLGAKFYEELNKVKQLCANMDLSIKEMRSKPVRLWKDIMFILQCHILLKEPYRPYRLVYRTEYRNSYFLGGGRGAYLKGGAYYKFWALGGVLIRSGRLFEAGR